MRDRQFRHSHTVGFATIRPTRTRLAEQRIQILVTTIYPVVLTALLFTINGTGCPLRDPWLSRACHVSLVPAWRLVGHFTILFILSFTKCSLQV